MNPASKLDTKLVVVLTWVVLGTIGDEVFALLFFQDADTALGFNLNKPWWWAYQAVLTTVFGVLYFLGPRVPDETKKTKPPQESNQQ